MRHAGINLVMRVYRYQYKKKKKINSVFMLVVLGIAAVIFLLQGKEDTLTEIVKEWKIICYEELLNFYLPSISYAAAGEENINPLEEVFVQFFLLKEAAEGMESYETQVESVLSYEAILAREAADENYVDDDTGEVVVAEDTPEAAEQPVMETGTGLVETTGKQVTYVREKLKDFDYLIQNFYQVDSMTTINGSQLNVDALLGRDLRLSHDASEPQILIYHTHSQEAYADSVSGDVSDTVVGVGDYLTQLLTEQYGMNVLHHTGAYDVGDRDHAYSKAGPALEQILAENPSIEVVIDLHRDGVAEGTRLVTNIGGVQMAQIMFFNGLSRTTSMGDIDYLYNPYIAENLAMSFQMQLTAAEYYPGFTRRIYLKGYRYNMHYCPKTLLIEVGAQTNTVEEAMNSMVPLADVLNRVLTGPVAGTQ